MKKQKKSMSFAAKSSNGNANEAFAKPQDAERLLKADHRKVEGLFQKFERSERQQAQSETCKQICRELIVHTMLEEEIFYPECRLHGVDDELLDAAQVEHDGAKSLITELMTEKPDAPYFAAKVKVLSEYIKHHVGEEEKSDGIFAKARDAGVDMNALGQRLQARKEELMEKAEAQRLGPPQVRSLTSLAGLQHQKENERMSTQSRYGRGYGGGGGRQSRFEEDDEDYRSQMYTQRRRQPMNEDEFGFRRYGSQGEYYSQGRGSQRFGQDRYSQPSRYGQAGSMDDQQRDYGQRYGRDYDDDRYGQRHHGGRFGQGYDRRDYESERSGGSYGQGNYDDQGVGNSDYGQRYGQGQGAYGQERYGQSSYDTDYDDMRSSRSRRHFDEDDDGPLPRRERGSRHGRSGLRGSMY